MINFMKIFRRNKRGMLGMAILVFFILLASAAPLVTSYDPVSETFVAGDYSYPLWYAQLIGAKYAENLYPVIEPDFSTSSSIDEWTFSTSLTESASVQYTWIGDIGNPGGVGGGVAGFPRQKIPGCIALQFSRTKDEAPVTVKANLTKQFNYPYPKYPQRFVFKIAMLADGVEDIFTKVTIFIQQSGQAPRRVWSIEFTSTSTEWTTRSVDSNESPQARELRKEIFSKPTTYTYGVEIEFKDTKPNQDVNATIYIDDLDIKLQGNAFGLLGTDHRGRDIFSQLIWGARISLLVGLLAAMLGVGIGLVAGLSSGYIGGVFDEFMMRFNDMLLVLPGLPLILVIVAVLGPSVWYLILILGLLGWMGFARQVRSMVLSIKERPFIEAAKAVGAGKTYIITRHVLPNVMSLVYVSLALSVPSAILTEAALSFLGLFDPFVMTWGRMLHDAQAVPGGLEKWWWVLPPGISIALVSLSFILLGYALDEVLNPKLRVRR